MDGDDIRAEPIRLGYTRHVLHVIGERTIPVEWVASVVTETALRRPESERSRCGLVFPPHRRIPEHGDRALRMLATQKPREAASRIPRRTSCAKFSE